MCLLTETLKSQKFNSIFRDVKLAKKTAKFFGCQILGWELGFYMLFKCILNGVGAALMVWWMG
jgi:hypothetical protein